MGSNADRRDALFSYVLSHGDDNLVLAQRLGEWTSRGPELEEDIALTNFALDHLGQARALLTYAGEVEGEGRDEDALAYHRDERSFTNALLVEQPNGDFAQSMARQLFFDTYQLSLWDALSTSADAALAGIAAKALKEARYHYRHSGTWVVRLGDGTEESRRRMQAGIDALWRFTGELFELPDSHRPLVEEGVAVDPAAWKPTWEARISAILDQATLSMPGDPFQRGGGRGGFHTEHLGHLLTELQYLQRAYPGLHW